MTDTGPVTFPNPGARRDPRQMAPSEEHEHRRVWMERTKQAFKAIAQDDTVALKAILDVCGSDFREYKNAAGESLLEFATDRKKDKTKTMLLAALIPASARSKKSYSTFMSMGRTQTMGRTPTGQPPTGQPS